MKTHWLLDIFLYMLGLCFNLALLFGVVYLIYVFTLRGYAFGEDFSTQMTAKQESMEIEFILEEDTPAAEVARMLEELGVIENQFIFRLELFLKNSTKIYKEGTYVLDASMSNTEVNRTLRIRPEEALPDNVITIREGFTLRDIALYLEDRELIAAEDFIASCDNYYNPLFPFLGEIPERPNKLEGYLFPDTYFLTPNATAYEIITKMITRFDEIFTYDYRFRARELGLTIDKAVIIASLIEREVRVRDERPVVAQVIYNRLNIGMRLQIDATVQYVLDKPKERLLQTDLDFDSPYNTYIYSGLPIGPISNPGADCIRAALYPDEDAEYLYYVLMDAETGVHYFSRTYEEHVAARARYQN